jgi:hypothetical protein
LIAIKTGNFNKNNRKAYLGVRVCMIIFRVKANGDSICVQDQINNWLSSVKISHQI